MRHFEFAFQSIIFAVFFYMRSEYNIYCDESCHLENDGLNVMVLGAIWCSAGETKKIYERIREIKIRHNLNPKFEIKWNKVSKGKIDFYSDLIDFYFDDDHLHFRALVIPDKSMLDHKKYDQSHDDFYFRMYFDLIKVILDPTLAYNIYLDIKDTKSEDKIEKLKEVLRNNHYDYSKQIIKKVQLVRSHEVELIQLADLLIGAIGYIHRRLNGNQAKLELIQKLRHKSKYSLLKSTLYQEAKMNIFIWKPGGGIANAAG